MTTSDQIDLSTYDPMDREVQQCPFNHYAALRDHGPLFFHEQSNMFFASRLDVVNEILRDTQTFSSQMSNTTSKPSPETLKAMAEIQSQGWPRKETMLTIDPPYHTAYRKLVSRTFSARRIAALEDKVRTFATELIDAFPEKGTVDFHNDFAVSFPVRVIHYALNMAPEVEGKVKNWSDAATAAIGNKLSHDEWVDAVTVRVEDQNYWYSEYEKRLEHPQDDVLSDLAHADFAHPDLEDGESRKLDFPEIYSIINQFMVAGNETTRNAIGWGLKYLTDNPDQRKIWESDFDAVAPTAVEEIVRLASPVTYMRRTTTQDVVIREQEIKAGDKVCMYYLAANRDEEVFDDPYKFDVLRQPNNHLGFGGPGPHFCLGAHLARREITVMFRELFRRLPDIEACGEPDVLAASFIHGVKHLPAKFTPTKPAKI